MRILLALSCSLLLSSASRQAAPADPVEVFAELDGKWSGTFVGYDATGKELYRISVEQEYETIDAHTQRVRGRDTFADGTVITAEGENTARLLDGELQLRCVVRKSNGERVEHDGRVGRGPAGGAQLIWYSQVGGRSETFREWVDGRGDRAVYHIHGMGRYGANSMLMAGRYARSR